MTFSKFIGLFLILVMASCAPQGSGILGTQSSFSQMIDSATAQAPFAYDIAPDTISYNSCVAQTITNGETSGIKAFKIGVSEGFTDSNGTGAVKGGLKLKTEFLQYMGKRFTPQTPNTTISAAQIRDVLSKSTLNQAAFLQFSIRKKDTLSVRTDMLSPGTNVNYQYAQPVRDVWTFPTNLGSGQTGTLLTKDILYTTTGSVLSEGRRIYNISESAAANPIEASFAFNKTSDESFPAPTTWSVGQNREITLGSAEYYAHIIRDYFNTTDAKTKLILTASFGGLIPESAGYTLTAGTSASTVAQLIRPASTGSSSSSSLAYGRGYALTFASKSSTGVAGWVKNTLSDVSEMDLSTGNKVTDAKWSCENYVIVKSNHWDNKKLFEPTCAPLLATDLTTARVDTIKKIRRHYNEKEWNVGLFYPTNTEPTVSRTNLQICLSSKTASCYLPTASADVMDAPYDVSDIGINYDTSKECYLTAYSQMGVTYSSSLTTPNARRKLGRCAQYASICVRSSTNY